MNFAFGFGFEGQDDGLDVFVEDFEVFGNWLNSFINLSVHGSSCMILVDGHVVHSTFVGLGDNSNKEIKHNNDKKVLIHYVYNRHQSINKIILD